MQVPRERLHRTQAQGRVRFFLRPNPPERGAAPGREPCERPGRMGPPRVAAIRWAIPGVWPSGVTASRLKSRNGPRTQKEPRRPSGGLLAALLLQSGAEHPFVFRFVHALLGGPLELLLR
jgi:hypothetical protein